MANNALRTPFVQTIDAFDRRRLQDAFTRFGKALPVTVDSITSSGIMVVKFAINDPVLTLPNVTVPLMGPRYIRYPIQKGEKGFVTSADASLASTAGFTSGTADLSAPANLESLVFIPCGNTGWAPVGGDGNALVMFGVSGAGVILQDSETGSVTTVSVTSVGCVISSSMPVTVSAGVSATIFTPSAKVTNGGSLSPVVTVAGPSTVLQADA